MHAENQFSFRSKSRMIPFCSMNSVWERIPSSYSCCKSFSCSRFFMRTSATLAGEIPHCELWEATARFSGVEDVWLPVKTLVIALARGVSASDKVSFFALFGVIPIIMGFLQVIMYTSSNHSCPQTQLWDCMKTSQNVCPLAHKVSTSSSFSCRLLVVSSGLLRLWDASSWSPSATVLLSSLPSLHKNISGFPCSFSYIFSTSCCEINQRLVWYLPSK